MCLDGQAVINDPTSFYKSSHCFEILPKNILMLSGSPAGSCEGNVRRNVCNSNLMRPSMNSTLVENSDTCFLFISGTDCLPGPEVARCTSVGVLRKALQTPVCIVNFLSR